MGGQFTLSDDSHGVAQVATHYAQTVGLSRKETALIALSTSRKRATGHPKALRIIRA